MHCLTLYRKHLLTSGLLGHALLLNLVLWPYPINMSILQMRNKVQSHERTWQHWHKAEKLGNSQALHPFLPGTAPSHIKNTDGQSFETDIYSWNNPQSPPGVGHAVSPGLYPPHLQTSARLLLELKSIWSPTLYHAFLQLVLKSLSCDKYCGRDWGQEEKGTTEDEMAGWHHQLDGHESE